MALGTLSVQGHVMIALTGHLPETQAERCRHMGQLKTFDRAQPVAGIIRH